MEEIRVFFADHPHYFGIVLVIFGIVLLLSAIIDAHWLFGDVNGSNYSLDKIDGWVNIFGRRTARVIVGIVSILTVAGGIIWFWLYTCY